MGIMVQPALTPNGNPYNRTRAGQVVGMSVAGAASAAAGVSQYLQEVPASKSAKAAAIGAIALNTLIFVGLGKIFGGLFDHQVNRDRADQLDILTDVISADGIEAPEIDEISEDEPAELVDDIEDEVVVPCDDPDCEICGNDVDVEEIEDEILDDEPIDIDEDIDVEDEIDEE